MAARPHVRITQVYRPAFGQIVRRSPRYAAMNLAIGRAGVAFGVANSPDAPVLREGYVDGWFSQYVPNGPGGVPQLEIANDDWKWHFIENGTAPHVAIPGRPAVSTRAHHLLARTLLSIAAGSRLRDARGRFI